MSLAYTSHPACLGKIVHATASGAYQALRRQTQRRKFAKDEGRKLNVYRCQHCSGWHLGNTDK